MLKRYACVLVEIIYYRGKLLTRSANLIRRICSVDLNRVISRVTARVTEMVTEDLISYFCSNSKQKGFPCTAVNSHCGKTFRPPPSLPPTASRLRKFVVTKQITQWGKERVELAHLFHAICTTLDECRTKRE